MKDLTQSRPGWAFHVPPTQPEELDAFETTIAQYKTGAMAADQFRAIRVPMGIYEQRESGTYMLRIRCPAGDILPEQLMRLGEVSSKLGNGWLHVTTRQEFQVHRVPLDSIMPALRLLAEAGLSTKGGGGNTVRNITACFDSGVCAEEVFDVAPYAVALTERFMPDPRSFRLPRKYKIACAGCGRDCAGATISDLGFVARRQNGVDGFAVYVAGGLGGKPRVASLLHEFIPSSEAFIVAESVRRVFDQHGNRQNKHQARLRFLVERIGLSSFRQLYETELAKVRVDETAPLEVRPYPSRSATRDAGETANETANSGEFGRWRATNVAPQKQTGFFAVHVPLELGDLPADKTSALADLVFCHGDGIIRATQSQNLVIRWIREAELPAVHQKLASAGLARPEPPVLRDLVACAGASTCRQGICLSRGLAKAIRRELISSQLNLQQAGHLAVHVSGCPNCCGRHPIGHLGFSGAVQRVDGRPAPAYTVHLGGRVAEGQTRFGTQIGTIPARNVPAFVREFLGAWQEASGSSDFYAFVDDAGARIASELIERYQEAPASPQNDEFYFDWDSCSAFSLAGRGAAECSAGA